MNPETTEEQRLRASAAIMRYATRHNISTSGFALMLEAWLRTEEAISAGMAVKEAVEMEFNEPLAGQIVRGIGKAKKEQGS